jgi:hypothetical protein
LVADAEPLLNAVLREQTSAKLNHGAVIAALKAKQDAIHLQAQSQPIAVSAHLRTEVKSNFPAPKKSPHQFLVISNWDASSAEGQYCNGDPRGGWRYPLDTCIFIPGMPYYYYILKVRPQVIAIDLS